MDSKEKFLTFLGELIRELKTQPPDWENQRLDVYLEAFAAWLEDMDGFYQNRGERTPAQMDWQVLRDALLAAKNYE